MGNIGSQIVRATHLGCFACGYMFALGKKKQKSNALDPRNGSQGFGIGIHKHFAVHVDNPLTGERRAVVKLGPYDIVQTLRFAAEKQAKQPLMLMFQNCELADYQTLASCGIEHEVHVNALVRQRGRSALAAKGRFQVVQAGTNTGLAFRAGAVTIRGNTIATDIIEETMENCLHEWLVVPCAGWPMEFFYIMHARQGLYLTVEGGTNVELKLTADALREDHCRRWTLRPGPRGSAGYVLHTECKDGLSSRVLANGLQFVPEQTCTWEIIDSAGSPFAYTMSRTARQMWRNADALDV